MRKFDIIVRRASTHLKEMVGMGLSKEECESFCESLKNDILTVADVKVEKKRVTLSDGEHEFAKNLYRDNNFEKFDNEIFIRKFLTRWLTANDIEPISKEDTTKELHELFRAAYK